MGNLTTIERTYPPDNKTVAVEAAPGPYRIIASSILAGMNMPKHHHVGRETFCIVAGQLDVLKNGDWDTVGPGRIVDMLPGDEHGLRNMSAHPTSIALLIPTKVVLFWESIGLAVSSLPLAETSRTAQQDFVSEAISQGIWLMTSRERALASISLFLKELGSRHIALENSNRPCVRGARTISDTYRAPPAPTQA